jgi:serine/threonine protein kinase/WD40 repeat protein
MLMHHWSFTLHGPSGMLSTLESGETQFVLGTEKAADVWTIAGEGVAPRHALVRIAAGRIEVEDLAGGTLVNGHPITGRVEAEYPASVQVGEVTLVVERKSEDPSQAATIVQSPRQGGAPLDDLQATVVTQRPVANVQRASVESANKAATLCEYTLVKEIARGGMGQIYFGEDPQLERQVAVKVSSISEGGEDPRFSKEAKVLALLAHPNIVPIYNIGVDAQSRPFYSMKLVKGRTLQAVLNALKDGKTEETKEYTQAALLTIFRKVCDAMAFAHAKGILHRDLKPENIMVGEYGEVLVMDWGLAKILGERDAVGAVKPAATDTGDYGMTLEGEVMGTPQYMSPEQAEGMVAELDTRSDVYSLGGILYAILTLRPPVGGSKLAEVLGNVKSGALSPMGTATRMAKGIGGRLEPMAVAVPAALQAVTLKAMSLNRGNRYASVEAFAADIEAYQNGFATSAEHAGFARQVVLLVKRNQAVSGLCAVLLVSAMVFSLRLIASERTARANERKALEERAAARVSRAQAQIALAQSEDQTRNPQVMRRVLDEVPHEYRDQQWSYLDSKLAPPAISFDVPEAPVEAAFPTHRAPGCFLTVQRNGDVRYLDPVAGFGSPLFRVTSPVKDLAFAFFEDDARVWLAVVTNRSARLGEKTYAASLEVLEVPAGKSVYKVGLDHSCVSVEFSPQGNLLSLGSLPPVPATIQVRNAYHGELVWSGGPKERVHCKFSPDEKRLVSVIENKGFQDLNPWTGEALGPPRNGPGRGGLWSPKADSLYAGWAFSDRSFIRGYNTADGLIRFEYTLFSNYYAPSLSCEGRWLFLTTKRASEGRVVEVLDAHSGIRVHHAYLIGNYGKYLTHLDENHFLCLGDKKVAFLRWNFAESLVAGLPRFDGPFFFMDGDSKVVARTSKDNKGVLKIFDLTKQKAEAVPGFAVQASVGIFTNKARDLFSYRDESRAGESVIARVASQGIHPVSRWKSPSTPQLSPSGERAWTPYGLYETTSGRLLQKYDRKDLGGTQASSWLDEKHLLEISWVRRKDENDSSEFNETVYVLWEVDTGSVALKVSEPRARTFGVSQDGRWIAEGGEDGRLRIRSAKTLEIQKEYKVHDSVVSRAEWHPTKPVIVTCSQDYWVKVWDARDGALVQSFRCSNYPTNIAMNRRGDLLGAGNFGSSQIFALDLRHVRD